MDRQEALMSDAGRMSRRLAGSYREDDRRRAAERRLRQAISGPDEQPDHGSHAVGRDPRPEDRHVHLGWLGWLTVVRSSRGRE
jgi:hypothetical protein